MSDAAADAEIRPDGQSASPIRFENDSGAQLEPGVDRAISIGPFPNGGVDMPSSALGRTFFERDVETVASDLVGVSIFINAVGGRIVETEAYGPEDPAAHSFKGQTRRNAAMFGPGGHAYVYRSYGLHWCMNFTCGHGAGVLIRAIEPEAGLEVMHARRGLAEMRLLCSGPGRLCQALGVDLSFNTLPLDRLPFELRQRETASTIIACPRIGISVATDTLWRFCEKDSRFLSKPIGRLAPTSQD